MQYKLSKSDWKEIGQKMGWLKKADFGTYGLGEEGDFGTPSPSGGPMPSENENPAINQSIKDKMKKPVEKKSPALEEACNMVYEIMSDFEEGSIDQKEAGRFIESAFEALERAAGEGVAKTVKFQECLNDLGKIIRDDYYTPELEKKYYKLKAIADGAGNSDATKMTDVLKPFKGRQ